MTESYYQKHGMINIYLWVPKDLKDAIKAYATSRNRSLQEVYKQVLSDFVASMERGDIASVTFTATYKKEDAKQHLQMWLPAELGEKIKQLAAVAHVSHRAFCYTALRIAFNATQEQ
jgi:hypothetical protein